MKVQLSGLCCSEDSRLVLGEKLIQWCSSGMTFLSECQLVASVGPLALVNSFCQLLDMEISSAVVRSTSKTLSRKDITEMSLSDENLLSYCFIWSFGIVVCAEDRPRLEDFVRSLFDSAQFPRIRDAGGSIFDFYILFERSFWSFDQLTGKTKR